MGDEVLVERRAGVQVITINRPEAKNALNGAVARGIAAAVDEQGATTREIASSIQTAAGNTARASDEIKSVEQAANQSAAAIGEIGGWTDRLSARAQDLETKVASFFNRVRAA